MRFREKERIAAGGGRRAILKTENAMNSCRFSVHGGRRLGLRAHPIVLRARLWILLFRLRREAVAENIVNSCPVRF